MASTDVIRGHARLRLSIKQLFGFKNGGLFISRDLERCRDVIRADRVTSRDLHPSPEKCNGQSKRCLAVTSKMKTTSDPFMANKEPEVWSTPAMSFQQGWREAPSRINVTVVPVTLGAELGGITAAAAMASKNESPVSMPPSGISVGGGRSRDDILNHSSFSSSHLSNMQDCVEELSTLGIADNPKGGLSDHNIPNNISQNDLSAITNLDNTEETQHLSPGVTKLLVTLLKFGVQSRPVKYREKRFRTESSEIFCKNLFLKDRRGQLFLVICDENEDINLKTLRRKLKAYRNFSFVGPEEMAAILKVSPGGVTPFALIHGTARDVRVAITTDLTTNQEALLNFHPLDQSLTLPVNLDQLKQFLAHFRFELEYLDMKS